MVTQELQDTYNPDLKGLQRSLETPGCNRQSPLEGSLSDPLCSSLVGGSDAQFVLQDPAPQAPCTLGIF